MGTFSPERSTSHYRGFVGMTDGIEVVPMSDVPLDALRPVYRDRLNLQGNCPGFYLWAAQGDNGLWYLMASDAPGGIETRLYFRTRGVSWGEYPRSMEGHGIVSRVVKAAFLGDNPDARTWDEAR